MKSCRMWVPLLAAVGWVAGASAATTVLYDGSTQTSPAASGYLFGFSNSPVQPASSGGQTSSNTSGSDSYEGGYSNYLPILNTPLNPAFPTLNRATGFDVLFTGDVSAESSTSANRAGFSIIALASDAEGVELDFSTTSVFAQNVGFTAGESATLDATTATAYDLSFLGSTYTLLADGTPLLSGPLRSYGSPAVPYTLPNYLFVGDDTTEAGSTWSFSYLAVSVPEPSGVGLAILSGLGVVLVRRRGTQGVTAQGQRLLERLDCRAV